MRVDIVIPASGESVKEGDIARWFKESGDFVELDEPLLELETDKASLEITADAAGRLTIDVPVGTTVKVGQVVGYVDTEAAAEGKSAPQAPAEPAAKPRSASKAPAEPDAEATGNKFDFDDDEVDRAKHQTVFNLALPSPAARKLISENRISSKDIDGSGREGRITKADVLHYLEKLEREEALRKQRNDETDRDKAGKAGKAAPAETPAEPPKIPAAPPIRAEAPPAARAAAPAPDGERNVRREKMSRLRKTIAARLIRTTQELAMLTTFNEVDMTAIMAIRGKYKESFKEKHQVGLGFMSFFAKAVCLALEEYPILNAMVDGDDIVYHDYCDIGVAVTTPRGLVVPCLRNAELLGFHEIESAIADLAKRGRDNKLTIEELSSGTFTITNGGIFGSMLSTPLINYPQSAILGMHNIVERPVARDGQVVIRPIMYVALSYDHRIIDGAEAVRFLVRVKDSLEDPMRLMLQV